MKYKLYSYSLQTTDGRDVAPDNQFFYFSKCVGPDSSGSYTEYRKRKDAVLMELRKNRSDFHGLIGRHSLERNVTLYDKDDDRTLSQLVDDNDYPHSLFYCFPRLKILAIQDNGSISANSALSRLHKIIFHRIKMEFVGESVKNSMDLRKAIENFRIVQVSFDVGPVNPHTELLGKKLDKDRAVDHIKRIKGVAEGTYADPLKLNGGFLNSVQQLQKSGHAKVGYKGYLDGNVEISVQKPKDTVKLDDEEDNFVHGENVDVIVEFPNLKIDEARLEAHWTQLRTVVRRFSGNEDE